MTKNCLSCNTKFNGRKDAKTCSVACRKRLQRAKNAILHEAGVIKQDIAQVVDTLRGEIIPVKLTPSLALAETEAEPETDSTSLQDSSWEPPYLDLPSAASFASGPVVTTSAMPLAGSSPVTRPAPATLATPAPLTPSISTPTTKPAAISELSTPTNEQLARTVAQPPAPAVEPTILSLETKASQASAPATPISALATASPIVPTPAVLSPINSPPSPAAFNFPSPSRFDLRNRLLPLLRPPPFTAALGALMLVVVIGGVFASSKLFNQPPKSTPVASTQADESLTEEGGILSLNLDTVVAKGKTFTVGQIIAGPGTSVLQVTGDVQSSGTLLASNGQTSLNNTGLKINDVVVCTAAGCKTGTTVTLASTLTGQVSLINLPSEVTIQGNTFNGPSQLVQLTSSGLLPTLSGVNLTNLNASNIASGSLADARLSANVALLNGSPLFKNTTDSTTAFRIQDVLGNNLVLIDTVADTVTVIGLQGSGANLTALNASNISSGTLADGRLSTNVSLLGQTIETSEIADGTIVNADVSATAAIAYAKLNLASSIVTGDIVDGTLVNADINAAAAIDWTKVNKTGSSFADFTTRSASDISSGTLAIARGGTGAGSAQAAIDNLSGLTTTGDLLYYDGANSARFARGANGSCLQSSAATITWVACAGLTTLQNAYDNGNSITTSDARNLTLTLADTTTDSTLTISTATGSTGFMTISRADGAGVADPAQLLLLDNLDLDRAQPIGLKLQSAAGALTTAIDASDAEIVTALAIGSNTITTTTTTLAATELDLLDGHDVALVDTNDAVATAIIGTGALASGSIAAGFGTIATANTITGTTLNGTTGINTGAGAGTQRIDLSGNLVNIGNLTATGAITIASAGAGNDIIINGADILDVQDATTFASSATFNGLATFNTDVDAVLAGTENIAVTSDLAGTLNVVSLVATPSASVGTTRGFFIQQADSVNANGLDAGLYIDNADINLAIPAAISIQNSGGGGYTTIIDNAGTLISGAELNLLDGHDVALVDTNDAVATAITGTGALAAGSLAAGFTTVAVARGGTGATTFTANGVLYGNTTAAIGVTAAGTTGQCLTGATGAAPSWTTCTGLVTLQNAYDNGNSITTSDARNLTLTLADTTTDSTLTISTATGSTGFMTISRADGAGAADPAQLLLLDNLDLDRAQPIGLKLQSAAGALTTAIDASDAEIVTALAIGSNTITTTTTTLAATELDLLDGHDVALVDTNDAVATAIIGTGALNVGSITSGFGTIDNADTITGTTLNGTTGINTGAGAGTNRIDASGNLVNIGNLTATGAITIASTGVGNDIVINGADILDIQDATTFTSTATFNGVSTFNTDVDLTLAGTENVALTSDLAGTVNVVSLVATPSATVGTTRGFFIQQADSVNANGLDAALYIDNADTNLAIPAAISIQNSGGGGYTTVIDNAGTLISGAELNLLDGHDVALVDTNDAVATAITGTGALAAGSLAAGFTTVAVGRGGTGATTFTANGVLYGNTTSAIGVTAAGTTGQCLTGATGAAPSWTTCTGLVTLQNAYDNGNSITTSDARNLTLTLADTTTDSTLTISTATGATGFTTISRADGAGVADPAQLLLLDNLDLDRAQPIGLKLQSAAGALTTAIDATDAEIVTALAIGSNTITTTTTTIASTELDLLDGHDVALVDTNDAVSTAIIGTGALASGSITAGFGTIDTGADNITTTGTVQGTTSVLTSLLDRASAGALNIGTTTATSIVLAQNTSISGASTFATGTGAVSLNGATTVATDKAFVANGTATFTDATNATTAFQIQNSSGINLVQVDTTTDSANLVTNGSLEVNTTGWTARGASTLSRSTAQQYLGLASLSAATTAAANDGAKYALALTSTTQYSLTLYARLSSGTFTTFEIGRADDGLTDTSCLTAQTVTTTGWTRFTCTFTTGTVSGSPYVYAKQTDATARTFFLDAVKVEAAASATPYREGLVYLNGNLSSPVSFKNQSDSTRAFQIQNAAGTSNLLIADTLNTRLGIGGPAANGALTIGTDTTAATGGLYFGTDTNLYRSAANTLKTDDTFEAGAPIIASRSLAEQVRIGINSGGNATIAFGTAEDTNLYRSAADTLKTDDTFVAAVALQSPLLDAAAAGALGIGNTTATSVGICNSAACDTLSLGTNADADAINIGDSLDTVTITGTSTSTIVLNGITITAAELNLLDGHDVALVDTNDAVATAIVGTGALNAGSITSGFGAIDTGADNITTTGTVQGTTSVLTSLLDRASAGALNIGTTTATSIVLAQNTSISGANTFGTGTGAVSLNGATTVANDKAFIAGGTALFKDNTNAATAFQVQNAAGINLVQVDTTTDSTNLVTNGSLEVDATGWTARGASTVSRSTTQQYLGLASLSVATTAAANDGAKYALSLTSTTQYTLTLFAKLSSGTFTTFEIGRADDGLTDTSCLTAQTVTTAGWTRFTCTFTTGTVSGSPYIYAKQTDATARTFFLDAVKLEAAAAATPYREGLLSLNGNINSPSVFKNQSDSTRAFEIQNAAGTNVLVVNTTAAQVAIGSSAVPANGVLTIGTDTTAATGGIYFGTDTNLYRGAVDRLATSDAFSADLNISADFDGSNRTDIGAVGPASESGIRFGSAQDTNLYRSAANVLKTDDNFLVQTASNSTTAFQVQNAAGINLVQIDTSVDSVNLITNGSLEVNTTGWTARGASTLTRSTAQQYLGLASLSVATTAAANDGAKYALTLTSTTQYTLTLFAKASGANFSTFEIGRADDGLTDTSCLTAQTVTTTGWTRFSCTFTTGTVSGSPYVYAKQTDATARTFFLDAVKLEAAASATPYREGLVYLNGNLSSPVSFKNQSDSTRAFEIQNAVGTSNLLIADTLNTRLGIGGPAANAVLTIGTDTTAATGGIYFGTDVNLYRSGADVLKTDDKFVVTGAGTGADDFMVLHPSTNAGLYFSTLASGNATLKVQTSAGSPKITLNTLNSEIVFDSDTNLYRSAADTLKTDDAFVSASTITGTTLNGTTGLNTGAGAGTQRIDSSGNLVNIGNLTGTGAITIASTGAGNDVTVDGADQFIVSDTSLFKNGANSTTAFQIQNAAAANLLTVDTSTTSNLVTNGDIEGGNTTGWTAKGSSTLSQVTTQQYQGNSSLSVATTIAANDGAKYAFTLGATTQYTLSLYAKVASGSITDVVIGRQDISGTDVNCLTAQTVTTSWTRFSCTFTTGATITSSNIYIQKSGVAAETFFIDAIQLQTGASVTAFDPGGKLQLAGLLNSPVAFQNKNDSTTAFQIQNAAGTSNLLVADTTNTRLGIGTASPLTTAHIKSTGTATTLGQLDTNFRLQTDTATANAGNEISFYGRSGGTAAANVLTYAAISAPVSGNNADTGAAGYLAFSTKALVTTVGLTERLRIAEDGNIGIGDSVPTVKLSLGGSGTANGIVLGDDAASPVNLYRSAADTLKTDDTFVSATALQGPSVDTAAAGTLAVGNTNATLVALNTDTDFTLAGTENIAITSDLAGTVNVVSLVATPSASVGTTRGFFIQQADSVNANGLDQALYIDNADTNLAIPAAISIQNSGGGGYTTIIDNAGTLISGAELNLLDGRSGTLVDSANVATYATTGVTAGTGLSGGGTVGVLTLNVVSANGGIVANADNIALTLQPSADALSVTTSSGSGLEILTAGVTLLQGCANNEILKWNETTDVWACATDGGGGGTLQAAYDGDTDTGDTIIALTAADDSLIFRNPAAVGSDSTYILTLDQLNTSATGCGGGVCGGLSIQSAGTGNLLLVTDTTVTARDVLTIANGGATTFRNQTDSTTAFSVQNAAGTSNLLIADTTNTKLGIAMAPSSTGATLQVTGNASATTGLVLSATGNSSSTISKSMNVSGTVAANDVVVIDTLTAGTVKRATVYGATGVFGIATGSGTPQDIVIGGIFQVTADTAAVAIGDQLVTSSTTGQVTPTSNPSVGTSIGRALSSKTSGASGLVWVQVTPGAGGSSGSGGMTRLYDSTAGAAVASFDAQNIPSGYDSLMIITRLQDDTTGAEAHLRFNNDSGLNYNRQKHQAQSTTVTANTSANQSSGIICEITNTANIFDACTVTIPNYADGSTGHRQYIASGGNSSDTMNVAGRWASTAAINRITILPSTNNFSAGSRVTVYGIGPNSGGTAAGAGGGEMVYTEFTSNVTVSAATEATANTIVTGSAYTFDGTTPVTIQAYIPGASQASLTGVNGFALYDGASSIGIIGQPNYADFGQRYGPLLLTRRLTPTAGSHTYSIRAWTTAGFNLTIHAGAGGAAADVPGYIRIIPAQGAGNATTLQGAYDMGRAITTTEARDISFTLADSTTTDSNLVINTSTSSTSKLSVQYGGTETFSISNAAAAQGSALFKNAANNTTAFQIQNAAGTQLMNVDSTNNRVYIGATAADATGTILVLDTKNDAGDPTGVNGATYYNSSTSKFRCYEAAAWKDCVGSATLQGAYDGSASPATIALADAKNLVVNAADTTTDPSIVLNLQCVTCSAGGGKFKVQTAATDVFTISPSDGKALFQNSTNSTTAFQVQNAAGTSNLIVADTTNTKLGIAMTPSSTGAALQVTGSASTTTGFDLSASGNSSSTITKVTNVSTTVTANDVVVIDTVTAGKVKTTSTLGATGVFGIATTTNIVNVDQKIVIGGIFQVTADTAAVAIGDQLVTSSTTGQVTPLSNPSVGTSIGRALSSKTSGASGLVWVQVTPGAGGSTGTGAMTQISDTTLGADSANFDIQNIPSGYTHLMVVTRLRGTTAAVTVQVLARLNNDSTANYTGTTYTSLFVGITASVPGANAEADIWASQEMVINDYTSGSKKTVQLIGGPDAVSTGGVANTAASWSSTAVVNRLTIFPSAGNWKSGSRVTVYGIGPNSGGTAAGAGAGETAYAQVTADTSTIQTVEASATIVVTAPAYTFDGTTPYLVETYLPHVELQTATVSGYVVLFEDGSPIGRLSTVKGGSTEQRSVFASRKITPTAGSHTYSIRVYTTGSTFYQFFGSGGAGANLPGYIRISPANGSGNATTLQGAYDMGRAITTTEARDISFTLADSTTTDSNFLVNVASSSTSKFALQNNGADAFSLSSTGDSANLITNGGIEVDTTGWSARGSATLSRTTSSPTPYLGLGQLKVVTTAAANDGAKYAFALVSTTQYTLTAFARLDSGSAAMATFQMGRADDGLTDTSCLTAQTLVTGGWTRFSCTFTTGTTSGSPYVYFKQTDAVVHTYYLDAVKLETGASATSYKEGGFALNGTITSPTTFKNGSDSTAALAIQNSSGTNLFVVDTLNNLITLKTASATPVVLVLSDKNTAGDPATCTNGGLYYNSNTSQIRACLNGAWNNAVGTNTGTTIPTTNLYDGRTFALRAGSTPFDVINLTYDATYAKWVSDIYGRSEQSIAGDLYTANTTFTEAASLTAVTSTADRPSIGWIPWGVFNTAGLTPQIRLVGDAYNTTGGDTSTISAGYRSMSVGETGNTFVRITTGDQAVTSASPTLKDTGWQAIPGAPTVKDFIAPTFYAKSTSGGFAHIAYSAVMLRWVSP